MRLRFTIRDLLWLTLVVALLLTLLFVKTLPVAGRWQFIQMPLGQGPHRMLDTASGHLWEENRGGWSGIRPPPPSALGH